MEEDRRNKLPANWEARRRKAEWEQADDDARKVRRVVREGRVVGGGKVVREGRVVRGGREGRRMVRGGGGKGDVLLFS